MSLIDSVQVTSSPDRVAGNRRVLAVEVVVAQVPGFVADSLDAITAA